ncbi:MAG TPA: type IV pilus modification protein PilV [Burkholderiales bacterium]|jgi:type IV pilus assembly protein PilV|nr:type IV pilus modification protein PilV [Burkholderiales bacterium]
MKPVRRIGSKQSGVTLLEALLGILIFSIGILAVVGMQAVAIKTVAESKYRMDASFLANEIIGEMWANRANLASYDYAGGTVPAVLTRWVAKVNSALPGAAANPPTIEVAAGNVVTVTIFWQHPEEANLSPPPPPHSHTVIASINCC